MSTNPSQIRSALNAYYEPGEAAALSRIVCTELLGQSQTDYFLCKDIELSSISLDDVDELTDIKIDKRKSSNERILDFLNNVKNPYVFKYKGRLVKYSFSENSKSADDCLSDLLSKLYK